MRGEQDYLKAKHELVWSTTKRKGPSQLTKTKLGMDPCRKFYTSLQSQSKQGSCDLHNPKAFDYSKSLLANYSNNNSYDLW